MSALIPRLKAQLDTINERYARLLERVADATTPGSLKLALEALQEAAAQSNALGAIVQNQIQQQEQRHSAAMQNRNVS